MMYLVQVDQDSLRARSDPLSAATALKVAKAWQSHGDRGVQIVQAGASGERSWMIRDFIVFIKDASAQGLRGPRGCQDTLPGDLL